MEDNACFFLSLPPEVVVYIFSFSTPATLRSCEMVCNFFRDLATEHLWKQTLHNKFFGSKRRMNIDKKRGNTLPTWKKFCLATSRGLERSRSTGQVLTWACRGGHHVVLAEILREENPSVETLTTKKCLHLSAEAGSTQCVELLASRGVNLNVKEDRRSAMECALMNHHPDVAEWLLQRGAPQGNFGLGFIYTSSYLPKGRRLEVSDLGKEILREAAQQGCAKVVESILTQAEVEGVNIKTLLNDKPFGGGDRPLQLAALGGHIEVIKFLLSKGADINLRPERLFKRGIQTPLFCAVANNHLACVAFLMENGATNDPPLADFLFMGNTPTQTPFHQACFKNSVAMVSLFLAKGIDINLRGSKNKTPLHYAASNPNPSLEFFEFMLNKGADPNLLADKAKAGRNKSKLGSIPEDNGKNGRTVLASLLRSGPTLLESESKSEVYHFILHHSAEQ